MLDYLRNAGKSAEEKHQEALSAYLDGSLSADERLRFEAELAADPELRAEFERLRALQLQLRALPARRVPRSYSLDAALHGKPKPQRAQQFYPVLRGATALTALFFAFVLGLNVFMGGFGGAAAPAAAPVAYEAPVTEGDAAAATEMNMAPESAAVMSAPVEESAELARTAPTEQALAKATVDVAAAQLAPQTESAADVQMAPAEAPEAALQAVPQEAPSAAEAPEISAEPVAVEPMSQTSGGLSPMTVLVLALGLVTLILGGLTLYLRRRLPF